MFTSQKKFGAHMKMNLKVFMNYGSGSRTSGIRYLMNYALYISIACLGELRAVLKARGGNAKY